MSFLSWFSRVSASMEKQSEVILPLNYSDIRPEIPWFLAPPLFGMKPKHLAYFHIRFMAVFCFKIAVLFAIVPFGLDSSSKFQIAIIALAGGFFSLLPLLFISCAACGVHNRNACLFLPLAIFLVIITTTSVALPIQLFSSGDFAVMSRAGISMMFQLYRFSIRFKSFESFAELFTIVNRANKILYFTIRQISIYLQSITHIS
ncbi:hypothetical protein PFISCL1PPCAC_25934, partial [Pristionchus fissidentatus]